ncbi:TolB-like translocation protein [Cohnella fermenti]|uniref:Oligogalacturonate lyase domain-containing protein n=1 Tax=Cohnella fermenti TaxID=2565925 RepID=A0A4S4C4P4_9BACL|nr:PD40 domain-containing protein [Cohnella fermenti]THF82124.1 hypothetical protein E6C55_06995 [Cohnella fermenti]
MTKNEQADFIRSFPIKDRWCVHSYYTLSPYAPDGSGRILLAGGDLERQAGEVVIVSEAGEVLERFGETALHSGFFHTGLWQTWSPDGRYVYYQSGTLNRPRIVRRELESGEERTMEGDMEGAPPFGEPIVSGLMGMLYAAGYGTGRFQPGMAPVPFQRRGEHGLFRFAFEEKEAIQPLLLSAADVLERHPDRERLLRSDREIKARLGEKDGLTLMCYCVRWNRDGSRLLFYFGNHAVDRSREEPRLSYVFTADKHLQNLRLAVDMSYGRPGVHWSWHPDGEHLIGYGPDPEDERRMCLAQVRYDGSGYRKLSANASGGHPGISPADYNLLVTDTGGIPGEVLFIDVRTDEVLRSVKLPRVLGASEPPGRNRYRVCHHPVFSADGSKLIVNTLPGDHAAVCEINVAEVLR